MTYRIKEPLLLFSTHGFCWIFCLAMSVGCSTLTSPISGVPAHRLPEQYFAPPKNDLVPIDISLLSQEAPRNYILDADDILGVYIEGVLPFNPPDAVPQLPPVHFSEEGSTLPPSIGFPIAVAEDGTISLPLIEPIDVRGRTVEQVRELIRRAYIEAEILQDQKARPVVTLLKERTYDVIVVRQDQGLTQNEVNSGSSVQRGAFSASSGSLIKLPAYQNDVLHALMTTGGLPGVTAKNEVKILRSTRKDKLARMEMIAKYYRDAEAQRRLNPCICPPPPPEDDATIRIPLRVAPGVIPNIEVEDVLLKDGDIVYIESRDREVFYTGGLLPGGEHPLPRDYDLDVLGAMAIVGSGIAQGGQSGGGGGGMGGGMGAGAVGGVPPGRLYILRKTPCNGQVAIDVDLTRAVNDPRQRPLIQAGDVLILQYKCEEEILNFGLGTFFTYGIQQLLQQNN